MTAANSDSKPLEIDAKGYLRGHWRGAQSLAWSFWVNLVLLGTLLLSVEDTIIEFVFDNRSVGAIAGFVAFVAARIIVYIWQIVGLVRACDRYQAAYGSIAAVWAVHFGIVISVTFACTSVLVSVHSVFLDQDEELLSSRWERERAGKYELTLSGDGTILYLNGSFEGGITKRLAALIEGRQGLKRMVLTSPGGNTFEGRGVAQIVRAHGFDTHVVADCFSACTIAFIAGENRTLGPEGRLGFHQYGLDARYQVPFVDIAKEQDTDRESFEAQKVKASFLEKVFDAPREELWIPGSGELVEAGVIHAVSATPANEQSGDRSSD